VHLIQITCICPLDIAKNRKNKQIVVIET
jgi:hypothetical protein